MNDSEKLKDIHSSLVKLSSKISVLQCLDIDMLFFNDVSQRDFSNVLTGIILISVDLKRDIEEVFKVIDI